MTRLRPISLVAAGFLCAAGLHAQTSAIAPRIVQSIDESNLVTLKGNVTALAQKQFDRGPADPAMQMTSVRLVLSRSAEQESALERFMAQQLDKSSPNYHHWLTPQQFGALYGPADSDIAAMVAWLQSRGLTVDPVPPGRTNIAFSGSVRQIEEAFHTSIHSFSAYGREFYSNTSDPQIPAALASVVTGVAGLDTLKPRSYAVRGPAGTYDSATKRLVPLNSTGEAVRPQYTTGSTGNQFLYVVAGDAATIYNTPNSFNANFSTGTSYTGKGVTIGIAGDGLIQTSTVQNYRKLFLGDSTAPVITNVGTTAVANADTDEGYLDTEVSGGLAPGAGIHFYVAANLSDAIQQAISDNTVDILSLSYGLCELALTTSGNSTIAGWWQQAAAQGIPVIVSTGDSGSAGCDDPSKVTTASLGLQVSGFASTPYNIAVGGTDFHGLLSSFSTYVSPSSANSATTFYRTALSYIPESTWNDSVVSNGTISANTPYLDSTSTGNITGGAGGASACSVNTSTSTVTGTCTSGYSKPSWQRGTGVPNDGKRDIPDVSLMAGNGFDGASWLVCTDDTSNSVVTDCTLSSSTFAFSGFGGTSAAAPAFAGILALVQQKTGSRLGWEGAKSLYDLFNGANSSAIFHDVITGNNSVPCVSTPTLSPNCVKNTAGYYFLTGYDTNLGYDMGTGIGSVDATQLVANWVTATGSTAATVTVTPSALSITTADILTVTVAVSGSGAVPTGSVTLTGGGYTSSPTTLSSGAASFTIPANTFAAGTVNFTATYSGDATYATSTGQATVTVAQSTQLIPTVKVSLVPATIDTNQSLVATVTVTGTGATPTGTVTLSDGSYSSAATALSGGTATITVPPNSLTAETSTLTATYSGDATYASATGTVNLTVTQSAFGMSATTPSAISAGQSATSSIVVFSTSNYAGTVSLSCALTSSPAGATKLPTCSLSASQVTLTTSNEDATVTATVSTTAASAQMQKPHIGGWMAGGGTALALLAFFGIPARRRRWRTMLGMIALLVAFGGLSACGGGGSSSSSTGGNSVPGTTSGAYVFTITGIGNPAEPPTSSVTFTLTVN